MRGQRKLLPLLGLLAILTTFVFEVVRIHPANLFGQSEDDSIYMSSAKAMAEGKGYVLASFPGSPPATKYPILYPWLLSWIWRWNPSFPSNLAGAIALNTIFGALYITGAFVFFRKSRGLSLSETLVLTTLCGLHPLVVFYSGSVLSEIPFAALTLGALLFAERAVEQPLRSPYVVGCGVLIGLCILTRGFGIPVAAGILIVAAARRAWRQLVILGLTITPFFVTQAFETIAGRNAVAPVSSAAASTIGWIHEWTYYTSYVKVWRVGVPTIQIFLKMLRNNLLVLLNLPANYFLSPLIKPGTVVATGIILLVVFAAIAGVFRDAHKKLEPIHVVLPCYLLLVLFWSYPDAGRFLLPFMPLLLLGVWIEAKRLLLLVQRALIKKTPVAERFVAAFLGLAVTAILSTIAVNVLASGNFATTQLSKRRESLLVEKEQAYRWIATHAPAKARAVAYEDASLYLYTGRQAARAFTFTTADFYDPGRLDPDLNHLPDVPRALGADFWVTASDDYGFEWPDAYRRAQIHMRPIELALPLVFRSQYGHVRIYSLECLHHTELTDCKRILGVLDAGAVSQSSFVQKDATNHPGCIPAVTVSRDVPCDQAPISRRTTTTKTKQVIYIE